MGSLNARGMAVIETKGACTGVSPAIPMANAGSQIFV